MNPRWNCPVFSKMVNGKKQWFCHNSNLSNEQEQNQQQQEKQEEIEDLKNAVANLSMIVNKLK
jgi:hypothetical protein